MPQNNKSAGEGEAALLSAIEGMPEPSRTIGRRLHVAIMAAAPNLEPRTWYGMPAYFKDGKALCFFRGAEKFKERYMTFGFNDNAQLDEGDMWPVAYALTEKLGPSGEQKIADLVKKAAG